MAAQWMVGDERSPDGQKCGELVPEGFEEDARPEISTAQRTSSALLQAAPMRARISLSSLGTFLDNTGSPSALTATAQ